MTIKDIAFRIEELQIDAERIDSLHLAVTEAVFNGNNAIDAYEWAFNAIGNMTFNMRKELGKLTDEAFDILKADSKGV